MDLLEGGELFDRIMKVGNFTEKDAFKMIIQLFEAVRHLHRFSIIHRDIKPENLILRNQNDFRLCLVDFGLSEFYS